jgi:hypothetical protein
MTTATAAHDDPAGEHPSPRSAVGARCDDRGGDAPCWAHLFDDDETDQPPSEERDDR